MIINFIVSIGYHNFVDFVVSFFSSSMNSFHSFMDSFMDSFMESESKICLLTSLILLPISLILIRLISILPICSSKNQLNHQKLQQNGHLMVLLGSGGHTGEMIRLLEPINLSQIQMTWLVSSGDSTSIEKVKSLSNSCQNSSFLCLSRARKVGQSLTSSIPSTIASFISVAKSIASLPSQPDVCLLNGPGTCVPIAYWLFFLRFFGFSKTRIIYVESLARVSRLSLTGLLILPITDRFLVQWENLARKYSHVEFYGQLI